MESFGLCFGGWLRGQNTVSQSVEREHFFQLSSLSFVGLFVCGVMIEGRRF